VSLQPSSPLYERRPKAFGIGGALPVKRDVRRFVKWPKYVRVQRQRRVLLQRLKVSREAGKPPDGLMAFHPGMAGVGPRGMFYALIL